MVSLNNKYFTQIVYQISFQMFAWCDFSYSSSSLDCKVGISSSISTKSSRFQVTSPYTCLISSFNFVVGLPLMLLSIFGLQLCIFFSAGYCSRLVVAAQCHFLRIIFLLFLSLFLSFSHWGRLRLSNRNNNHLISFISLLKKNWCDLYIGHLVAQYLRKQRKPQPLLSEHSLFQKETNLKFNYTCNQVDIVSA